MTDASASPSAPTDWRVDLLWGCAILAFAFGLRLLPWDQLVDPSGGLWLFGDDPPYHLRRALLTYHGWPSVPGVDPAVNYPHGAKLIWPPGLAWLLAGLTKLASPAAADVEQTMEQIAAVLPPVVGALTSALVFFVLRPHLGRALALIAAALVSCSPAQLAYTAAGRFDHHMLEALLVVWLLASVAASLGGRSARARWLAVGSGALSIGVALAVWPGVLLHLAFVGFALWLAPLLASWLGASGARELLDRAPGLWGAMFALSALAALPTVFSSPWSSELVFFAPSLFHLCALLALALSFLLASPRWSPLARLPALARWALAPLAPLALFGLVPALRTALVAGIGYVAASPLGKLALESHGVLTRPAAWIGGLGWLSVLALSVLVVGLVARRWSPLAECFRQLSSPLVLWIAALFALLIPALAAIRWQLAYAPLAALAVPLAWRCVLRPLGARVLPERPTRWCALWAVLGALIAVPMLIDSLQLWVIGADDRAVQRLAKRLKTLSPPVGRGYARDATLRPAYGALTSWEVGHIVSYRASRPTLANNFFGTPFYDRANRQAFALQLTEDCERAARELAAKGLRYVFVTPIDARTLEALGQIIGRPRGRYASVSGRLQPAALRTLWYRLGLGDGRALQLPTGQRLPACGRFRLLVEAHLRSSKPAVPGELKIFERVEGAKLTVRGEAGQPFRIALPLLTEKGRRLLWSDRGMLPPTGEQVVRLPYPTDGCWLPSGACPVRVTSPYYALVVGSERRRVRVSRVAVERGLAVR